VVPPVPAHVTRHFLTWETPLLPAAVAWLARDWTGHGPLDLSRQLVVVATRQAGRRLRAGLAAHAAAHGQAVFSPRVVQPEALVAPVDAAVATPLQATLAWAEVLRTCDLAEFRAVFPIDPPERHFAWARRLAGEFSRLQATLAEAGLALDDVAARLPAGFPEEERWRQLGALGRAQAAVLAARGRREPQAARLAAAQEPAALDGIDRIVLLAVTDPLPLALKALGRHAARVPVEVVVAAPASEAAAFDEWGRPRESAWQRREPPFTDFATQVHLCPDAEAQAERIADLAQRYATPGGSLGVGLADPALAPLAAQALARVRVEAFDPAGEPRRARGLHLFLTALADFARDPSYAHTLALARLPETLDWLRAELGASFSTDDWLRQLDDIQAEGLPATLGDALRAADVGGAAQLGLARLFELRGLVRAEDFAAGAAAALGRVFAHRALDLSQAADRHFQEAARAWGALVEECASAAAEFPRVTREEWWDLALERFGEQAREGEKAPGAVDLQGWLELPWEDAPHVVVAGVNDGAMPEAVTGDVFLPESLRVVLGLKSNAARFARDACLLHALLASRRAAGRVDLLVAKRSASGDPLRPSRLLLQCPDDALPQRIAHLFRELEPATVLPAWSRAWPLRPRRAAAPETVSVTAFRSYLECPYRFYLKHVLRMEALDAGKRELDVFDFGRLCHKPLEKLLEPTWRDCTDERALGAMFVEELDQIARARYGGAPTVPLVAQLESARQRLRAAARIQVGLRAEGWVVQAIERKFQLPLGGLTVKGQIDRIDRHEGTGEWRVIDYKTSDTAKTPHDAHIGSPWTGTPAWARLMEGARERQWLDLQLPLYLHALPLLVPEAQGRVACGYFNLPKAATATALLLWDEHSPALQEQAIRCAGEIAAAVRAGIFWPPNEEIRTDDDDFGVLFHRGVEASVAWEVTP
jgi:ATP-dependent helicase/nuclease subunit B